MGAAYPYILAIHIIFVVCWFAGLFYIVRLFIYHTEAQEKQEPEKNILSKQFEMMERRLWNIITVPSMYIVIAAGIAMLFIIPGWLHQQWLHIKLTAVVLLIIYHFICENKIKQMRKGIFKWKSTQLRLWNELATLLLFLIVICAVVKDNVNWPYTIIGFVVLVFLLMVGVKIYKYYRLKNNNEPNPGLKKKIDQIKSDIEDLVKPYCDEEFRVDWYGAYNINPKHLVFWICIKSDALKDRLKNNDILHRDLRSLLDKNDYPSEAREHVKMGFESQETVDRESNGNWYHHFK